MSAATIIAKDGTRYTLSDNDVLWAARMTAFEGGDPVPVLWTMTQRFVQGGARGTFADFIRRYAQPINPKWSRGGACCCGPGECPAGRDFCGEDPCSETRLARRQRAQTITWAEMEREDPEAVRATRAWATAQLSNPVPGAVHFAAPTLAASKLARNPDLKLVAKAGNWFLGTTTSLAKPRDYVKMAFDGRTVGPSVSWWLWGLGAVGLSAVGAGAWYYYRSGRLPWT
jgi:hypothetical protein